MKDKHAQFDGSVPANYDRFLGPVLFAPYAIDLTARLRATTNAVVLELACGTGILTQLLSDNLVESGRLVATDLNEPMLRYARAKLDPRDTLSWSVADASALPFAPAAFDSVVCQFGLMFFPDKATALGEVRRVLRPEGTFCFNVWDAMITNELARITHETVARLFPIDPPRFYEVPFSLCRKDEVIALLREAGFGDIDIDVSSKIGESATAQEVAVGLIHGNPIITAIRERGTVAVAKVVEAVASAVEVECGTAPVRAKMQALVVTARAH